MYVSMKNGFCTIILYEWPRIEPCFLSTNNNLTVVFVHFRLCSSIPVDTPPADKPQMIYTATITSASLRGRESLIVEETKRLADVSEEAWKQAIAEESVLR